MDTPSLLIGLLAGLVIAAAIFLGMERAFERRRS